SARNLNELAGESAPRWLNDARHLHRDGRTARYDMTIMHTLPRGTNQSQRVYSRMPAECAIFVLNERIDVKRRYFIERDRMPPHMILSRKRSQRRSVTRQDDDRIRRVAPGSRQRKTAVQYDQRNDHNR